MLPVAFTIPDNWGKDGTAIAPAARQGGAMHGKKTTTLFKMSWSTVYSYSLYIVGKISGLFWFIVGPSWAQQMNLADPA